jgi:glucokinase
MFSEQIHASGRFRPPAICSKTAGRMRTPDETVLLGDIGGTNARFALLARDGIGPVTSLPVENHAGLDAAVSAFLAAQPPGAPAPVAAALAVAGPVEANRSVLTNSRWEIDGDALARRFGLRGARVLNDFESLAWSLPHLGPADLRGIGRGAARPGAPIAVLGPGTGLGMACYVPVPGGEAMPASSGGLVLAAEGGHATLAGADAREDAILAHIRARHGHVSGERAVSGPGLENLHDAVAAVDGAAVPAREAEEITALGLSGACPVCRAALDLFCALLGSIAGNAALAFGARGGVLIGGGIPPRILPHLESSAFRARFEAKGRLSAWLAEVPTAVVVRPDAALLGLAALSGFRPAAA